MVQVRLSHQGGVVRSVRVRSCVQIIMRARCVSRRAVRGVVKRLAWMRTIFMYSPVHVQVRCGRSSVPMRMRMVYRQMRGQCTTVAVRMR